MKKQHLIRTMYLARAGAERRSGPAWRTLPKLASQPNSGGALQRRGPAPHPRAHGLGGSPGPCGRAERRVWSRAHLASTDTSGPPPQQVPLEPPVLYVKTTEERPSLTDCENERWYLAKKEKNDHLVCCFSQSRCQRCFFRTNESLHRSSLRAW